MHIVKMRGWECVGAGRDFSGAPRMPKGLEDVSKFPRLIEALIERDATDEQVLMFACSRERICSVYGPRWRRS
jgi:membrane dipeptidase